MKSRSKTSKPVSNLANSPSKPREPQNSHLKEIAKIAEKSQKLPMSRHSSVSRARVQVSRHLSRDIPCVPRFFGIYRDLSSNRHGSAGKLGIYRKDCRDKLAQGKEGGGRGQGPASKGSEPENVSTRSSNFSLVWYE